MIKFLAIMLMYLPPLLIGVLVFYKLKKKYARPLDNRIDPRVWLISAGATAGGYLVYITLLALVAALLNT